MDICKEERNEANKKWLVHRKTKTTFFKVNVGSVMVARWYFSYQFWYIVASLGMEIFDIFMDIWNNCVHLARVMDIE
jgi:hypothetical protein